MAKKSIPSAITADDRNAFADEFEAELQGSVRAIVLVAGAMLDELLRRLLYKHFVEAPVSQEILDGGPNAPLGSFSARIKMSFAIGLISEAEMKAIDAVRSIRNDYAHKLKSELMPETHAAKLQGPMDFVSSSGFTIATPAQHRTVNEANFKIAFIIVAMKLIALMTERLNGTDPTPGRGAHKPSL